MSSPRPRVQAPAEGHTRRDGSSRGAALLCAAVLVLGVTFAFGGARTNAFILLDDPAYITQNAAVRGGLTASGARWAFTTFEQSNWHPLTWLSHMVDVEFFGLDAGAHHVVNVAWHALSSVLLFALLLRWTRALVPAFLAAAFFAWHPLRAESVVWAAERKDVLSVAFGLLALHAWTSWVGSRRTRDAVFAHAAFAASLLAKPTLVTLPFLLLVLDVWPFARTSALTLAARVREKLGFFALAFASSIVTYAAQSAGGSVISSDQVGALVRVANALESVLTYSVQLVWPSGLAVFYPHTRTLDVAAIAAAIAFVAAAGVCAWRGRKTAPAFATGVAWFAGSLVPMLGLVQVGGQAHADRYTYWPSIGFALALVFGSVQLAGARFPRAATHAVAAGVCLALGGLAWAARAQTELWRDTRTLFAHTRALVPETPLVRVNLGNACFEAHDFEAAIEHYAACVELDASFREALNGLGTAHLALGHYDAARAAFERAIAIGRDGVNVRSNLGVLARRTGKLADARAEFERALAFDPGHFVARLGLGEVLQLLGDHAGALKELARARELEPRDVEVNRAYAGSAFVLGRDVESIAAYKIALAGDAGDVESLEGLAWLRAMAPDPALRDAREALALAERAAQRARADDARAHDVLSAARAENGDFAGALTAAARAIELYRAAGRAAIAEQVERRVVAYRAGRTAH